MGAVLHKAPRALLASLLTPLVMAVTDPEESVRHTVRIHSHPESAERRAPGVR